MRLGIVPPAFGAIDSPAFTIFRIDGKSFDSTKTIPLAASAPASQKNGPPFTPGIEIVSVRPGGVKMPLFWALAKRAVQATFSSGVMKAVYRSFSVMLCRANGGGMVGKGCVGEVHSPGTSDFGTGRSSIGH